MQVPSAALGAVWLATACGGGGDSLRARAAKDLDCPDKRISVQDEGHCSFEVRGCGKRAAYFVRPRDPASTVCCPPAGCDIDRESAVEAD